MSRGRQTRDFLSEPLPDPDTPETFHFAGHLYVEWSRYREEAQTRARILVKVSVEYKKSAETKPYRK